VAFINEYTRYCPKCGQECGIEYKETIPWIPCSERMPPDDETKYIFKDAWNYWPMYIQKGCDYITGGRSQDRVEWIPYDKETWEMLTDKTRTKNDN